MLFVIYAINAVVMLICLMIAGRDRPIRAGLLVIIPVLIALGLRFFGYIKFIPFAKEMFRSFEKSRKGRYYSYLIKRFRQNATRADSIDSFRAGVRELVKLDDIGKVEIILGKSCGNCPDTLESAGSKMPDFVYLGNLNQKKAFMVAFPIVCGNGNHGHVITPDNQRISGEPVLGLVRMTGNAGGDFPLYCAEVAQALSEEVAGFLAKSPSFQSGVPEDREPASSLFV